MAPAPGLMIQWNAIVGERYFIETKGSLTPGSPGRCTAPWSRRPRSPLTRCRPPAEAWLSTASARLQLFDLLHAPLTIQLWTNNQVRLSWPSIYLGRNAPVHGFPYHGRLAQCSRARERRKQ